MAIFFRKARLFCIHTIFRLFRLKPGTSLFERLPPRTSSVSRGVKPSCACVKKGNRRFNTCDVKPIPDTDKGGKPVKPIKVRPHPKKPGKTDNRDYDPNSVNYVFKPPKVKYRVPTWPTPTGITRKKAIKHCKRAMSRILRLCNKVISAKKLKVMTECVTDIKVSCVTTALPWSRCYFWCILSEGMDHYSFRGVGRFVQLFQKIHSCIAKTAEKIWCKGSHEKKSNQCFPLSLF